MKIIRIIIGIALATILGAATASVLQLTPVQTASTVTLGNSVQLLYRLTNVSPEKIPVAYAVGIEDGLLTQTTGTDQCGKVGELAPGASCTLAFYFTPNVVGVINEASAATVLSMGVDAQSIPLQMQVTSGDTPSAGSLVKVKTQISGLPSNDIGVQVSLINPANTYAHVEYNGESDFDTVHSGQYSMIATSFYDHALSENCTASGKKVTIDANHSVVSVKYSCKVGPDPQPIPQGKKYTLVDFSYAHNLQGKEIHFTGYSVTLKNEMTGQTYTIVAKPASSTSDAFEQISASEAIPQGEYEIIPADYTYQGVKYHAVTRQGIVIPQPGEENNTVQNLSIGEEILTQSVDYEVVPNQQFVVYDAIETWDTSPVPTVTITLTNEKTGKAYSHQVSGGSHMQITPDSGVPAGTYDITGSSYRNNVFTYPYNCLGVKGVIITSNGQTLEANQHIEYKSNGSIQGNDVANKKVIFLKNDALKASTLNAAVCQANKQNVAKDGMQATCFQQAKLAKQ